jgi:hypothetical protein
LGLEWNADAAVLHLEPNLCVHLGFALFGNPNDHLPFAREFHGVTNKVGQDLPQPPRIPRNLGGTSGAIALASSMPLARARSDLVAHVGHELRLVSRSGQRSVTSRASMGLVKKSVAPIVSA